MVDDSLGHESPSGSGRTEAPGKRPHSAASRRLVKLQQTRSPSGKPCVRKRPKQGHSCKGQAVGVIASVQPWACDQAPCTGSGRGEATTSLSGRIFRIADQARSARLTTCPGAGRIVLAC
jgi:hypothetical protein